MPDRKIRVLMCGSDVTNTRGGITSVIRNYLEFSMGEDIELSYVATHMDGSNMQKLKIFRNAFKEIEKALKSGKVDIAHLHMSERGSIYRKIKIAGLCHKYGVPVIIHHHGAEFFESVYSMNEKEKKELLNVLKTVEMNLVLSRSFLRNLKKLVPEAKVMVLHNAVRVLLFSTEEEKKYITMMGRMGQRKGTYDLLNVIKSLDSELDPSIKFCLCGDGEVEKVKSVIEKEGLQKRIAHVGWIAGEKKLEILGRTMTHVLPSYGEGLPMSVLETMGMGIPNIATDIDGISEVIENGENGILIDSGEPQQLEEAIREIVNNPDLRRKMSVKALETIKDKFSLEKHIRTLIEIYKEIEKKHVRNMQGLNPKEYDRDFSVPDNESHKVQNKNIFRDMPKHRGRNALLAVMLVVAILGTVIIGNVIQNRTFGTTFYRVESSKILNDVRIVLLTDLHNHEYGTGNLELVNKIKDLEPDIIAMAGDMVVKDNPDTSVVTDLCSQLLEIAPVYYSMGNHEGEMIYNYNIPLDSELKELGVTVFYNDSVDVDINGNQFRIGGVGTSPEDFEEYSESFVEDFEKTEDFKLLLAHYPSLFYDCMADADIDLALSGHFHGGQIQVPGLGGLFAIPFDLLPEYCDGIFTLQENGKLVVSRGLGDSSIIPRINNKPELVVVDLRKY